MINPFSNPSYLLPPLVVASVIIALMILVWKKGRRDFNSQLFITFLVMLGMWAVFTFAMRSSDDIHQALPWEKALVVAAVSAFAVYYHFTLAYTNIRTKRWTIPALYSSMLALAILLTTTDLAIQGMRLADYGYAPVIGPLGPLFFAPAVLFVIGGAYNLLKRYKASTLYEERNRLIYLMVATLFPIIGAGLDAFSDLPPVAIWSNLAFCTICTVAILKYHLLDIWVVARKSLTYLFVSGAIAIPYVGVLFLLVRLLKTPLESWWVHGLIIILLALALRPLYSWAQRFVDRLFYRDRYDYLRALEQFAKQSQSISDLERLGSTVVKLMSGALRTSNACLLLTSQENGGLAVTSTVGLDDPPSGVGLKKESLLVSWLRLHDDIVSSKEFNVIIELQNLTCVERQNLNKLQAELYIPIKARQGELSGLLTLGEKLSHQTYSDEDRRLLSTIASQIAVAIENARLYRDALHARENLMVWLNSMSDCVIIVNADHTMQFMNKAAAQRFDGSACRTCWNILGKDGQCSKCPLQQHPRKHEDVLTYAISVGDREYDAVAALLLNPDGSGSVIEVLRDTTERKRAVEREKQLQEQLNLSSRLASIGELAAGVAHEINNPLAGIAGFSQRLLRKCTGQKVRQDLERIHSEAMRAAKVLQNLLVFARHREPKKQYSDINDIVQKTLELRAYELKTSNIEVVTKLAPALPKIMVDFHQIQEVFLNIILNAEQVMIEANHRGELSIKTQKMKDYIRILFTDDGPGIPTEHLNKVFDPFFTLRRERGGTGLGLSISHGIVAKHGGRIYVRSKPGKGAMFIVELPLTTQNTEQGEVMEQQLARRSK